VWKFSAGSPWIRIPPDNHPAMTPEFADLFPTPPLVPVAIRELVEFALRAGDLRSEFTGSTRAVDGIRGHQAVQRARPDEYRPEVTVSREIERCGVRLALSGRIDGVFPDGTTLEEIKTTLQPLENLAEGYSVHWAQAEIYAWIWAGDNALPRVAVQLTYYNIDSKKTVEFRREYHIADLETHILNLLDRYASWRRLTVCWNALRDRSLADLPFPFGDFRPGQRDLSAAVFRSVRDHKRLFAHAPTGIGKTMGVLYPAMKALGAGAGSRIFYLTAKTTGQGVAEAALDRLRDSGMYAHSLTLTAKDKLCLKPDADCMPDECPYAEGFFDRLRDGLDEMANAERMDREWILAIAEKHRLCPFEFSLEVALWCDVIICDYNYVFDPRASLKRFFMEPDGRSVFLIDEAHNLPERAREMFSAEIGKRRFLDLRKAVRETHPTAAKRLNSPNKAFLQLRKDNGDQSLVIGDAPPAALCDALRRWQSHAEEILLAYRRTPWRALLLEIFFEVAHFLRTTEAFADDYAVMTESDTRETLVRLRCLDPARQLRDAFDKAAATVLFSGTLLPQDYFVRILGGTADDRKLRIPSPFPRENRGLFLLSRIATRFKMRAETAEAVAEAIRLTLTHFPGNHLVFFPSYPYLQSVAALLDPPPEGVRMLIQSREMDDAARAAFLASFESGDCPTAGFAVMGGVFAEGIDLVGDKLSGAIIVGVGLPQIGPERDLIRDYFDRSDQAGFEFAYQYPGFNRVLQAAGRVIRSENDRGVVVLIDERFNHFRYRQHFPVEWDPVIVLEASENLPDALESFRKRFTD
jgi:DNA excision repair protein ERCC-2